MSLDGSRLSDGAPRGPLSVHGTVVAARRVVWNASTAALYEEAVRLQEGLIAADGPLVCLTGAHTGRSPQDKFIVREASSEADVDWGPVNQAMSPAHFAALERDLLASLAGRDIFVQDLRAAADPRYELPVRVVTQYAWHSLFAKNLLIAGAESAPFDGEKGLTIVDAPDFTADPARHGTHSDVVIAVHFARRLVLIGGTQYAGEIKKSVFSVLNYLLPREDVLPMHCSANIGTRGDTALFFGLSGTGKTTISSDPERRLIGDDEHGWSDQGVFNIEGGCYAKTIRLSPTAEPGIFRATRRFGTVLENVVMDEATRHLDLDDARFTENTRAAYPLAFIEGVETSARGRHPEHIIFLTADAFGVLPPVARLTPAGAMYHFLSGYTAKVAGTERGVREPNATFSACFGAPFLPLAASRYAEMLGRKIAAHGARVWIVNTGWTGGAYGTGRRMPIEHTRAMVRAALGGELDTVPYERDRLFKLDVPTVCPGVPAEVLRPRAVWPSEAQYVSQAEKLARMFAENFTAFAAEVTPDVRAAGPGV